MPLAASNVLFVLGASDPEMHAIEQLLAAAGVSTCHAQVHGKRVYPANAYQAEVPAQALERLQRGDRVYLVECVANAPPGAIRIDHHHAGDPGYGRAPTQYWEASSLGQTVAVLAAGVAPKLAPTPALRMIAAADHCLGAAYQGQCAGVDPEALLAWHVASRAAFLHRPEAEVLQAIEAAQRALREAAPIELAPGVLAADMRARSYPELPLAAAREGQCCVSAVTARDGRTKIGCLIGSPLQIESFMHAFAPAHHLVGVYGDAIRGFAGAYVDAT